MSENTTDSSNSPKPTATPPPAQPQQHSRWGFTVIVVLLLVAVLPLVVKLSSGSPSSSSSSSSKISQQILSQQELADSSGGEQQQQRPKQTSSSRSRKSSTGRGGGSSSSSSSAPSLNFFRFVSDLLQKHSGSWSGILDAKMAFRAASVAKTSESVRYAPSPSETPAVPCEDVVWRSNNNNQNNNTPRWSMQAGMFTVPQAPPSCMAGLDNFLRTTHFLLSVGLSRVALDEALAREYDTMLSGEELLRADSNDDGEAAAADGARNAAAKNKPAAIARREFELDVAKIIAAYLTAAQISLQIYGDSFEVSAVQLMKRFKVFSPAWSSSSSSSFSLSSAARWLRRKMRNVVAQRPLKWERNVPMQGRFWNSFRATLSCSSLTRTCENPEGCRYLCNAEYALRDKSEREGGDSGGSGGGGDGFEIVGFGSNNEFDWEDSMIDAIERATKVVEDREHHAASAGGGGVRRGGGVAENLKSITTFDCTLLDRRYRRVPGVFPSATVKSIGSKFRFVPFCLGGVADAEVTLGSDLSAKEAQGKTISMAELVSVLEWQDGSGNSNNNNNNKNNNNNDKNVSRKINLFKIDIESFEFVVVPRWLQMDLSILFRRIISESSSSSSSRQRRSAAKRAKLDKDDDVVVWPLNFQQRPLIDIDQFQYELHRRGHTRPQAAFPPGAMWMLWLQLGVYAQGFVPVVTEKNHYDNCCFEQVAVHYRYFLKSEAWLRS